VAVSAGVICGSLAGFCSYYLRRLTRTACDRAGAWRDLKKREPVKKRSVRKTATRNKDSKPKDEKEVMNFFDNLLKK